ERFTLPSALTDGLQALSNRQGATLFMTLLAAYQALLGRYSGQDDVLVGTPIAGRTQRETEGLIGFFVNTLVMRADLSGMPSFAELVDRVREMTLGAYAHQDVPFEKLVEELQPVRDMSRSPLFQVMFDWQDDPLTALQLPGLTLAPIELASETAKFDITLSMRKQGGGLVGAFEYNTDLFDATTIARMCQHFQNLLTAVVVEPEKCVSELPLLTDAERHQLLVEWNDTSAKFPQELCIHQFVERQATRTPERVAVVYESLSITYRELNERANQVAHYLQKQGVGPEVLVGICVERTLDMIVGLLGILKAGGAYVPLDPSYPQDRLAFMLEDSQISVLVTQEQHVDSLPAHGAVVVCLDRDWSLIEQESVEDVESGVTPDNLAYIIYTSGSTGKPKGVLIPHANVGRLMEATEHWYGFDEQDVWTVFHSYAFDFSVWEIWGALFYGGKLVVVPYWVSRSPDAFYDLLVSEQVTVLNQTPSAFRQLMQAEERQVEKGALALRYVIFGGEALELQSLVPWFERHGDQKPQLVNMYGITETTVHVTYRTITMEDVRAGAGSVIGVPIPDLQVYVLDGHLQPVPIGVAGEMYVGGAGVARGYLNRADLTEERFIRNPFDAEYGENAGNGSRLYKTGDLARMLPSGELEYYGRIDHQVKIRGFRIELGEIESVLVSHPLVAECVVIAREDVPGDKRLVAYFVADATSTPEMGELRSYLKEQLPEYMVPSAFVWMESMPLTANGKTDLRALPAPDLSLIGSDRKYVAPRTPVEEMLAGIWADVLHVEQIGMADNFFELGGHSLLATQVMSRVNEAFGLQMPLRHLFESPTVAAFAEQIEHMRAVYEGGTLPAIQPISREGSHGGFRGEELPLSFAQQRLWVIDQLMPGTAVYSIPFAVRLQGDLHVAALEKSLNELISRHESLRT
ncbi:MAG: non-ribosomal peptide synthetase, partial [Tumebacillaceae bacterium]